MRILHLTPELPFAPGGGGGQTHEFFLLRRLAELGHDVLNISPAEPGWMRHTDALRGVGVRNWVAPRPASQPAEAARAALDEPAVFATALTSPVRALEMRVFWRRLRPLTERALREHRPDVVLIGHDMAAAWAADLPAELPKAITLHNLTWRWYESRARLESGPRAALLRAEGARYRRHVLRHLPHFDLAIALSTIEAEEVRATDLLPVEVIPVGVDTVALAPAGTKAGPPSLLFTGTMSYEPNARGIEWFADRVWPQIRARHPDITLDVVGKDPPPSVTALQGDGIAVHGFVPSMAPFFARATVVVVPILTGAGIRVKIIEAMAAAKPIVSTRLGWEGLAHVEPGTHLLEADGPEAFAAETLRLLDDATLRAALSDRARDLAVREYDWRALGDRLSEALTRCASR